MKKILICLILLTISIVGFAQSNESETAKPLTDTEIVRRCDVLDVEGKYYYNVKVTIKSNKPSLIYDEKYKVKVTVVDTSDTKVWNKTFKNAFLYVFSNGQIQIGKKNFDQMIISKSSVSDNWIGIVREKEGIY